jgi:hypothetical protein
MPRVVQPGGTRRKRGLVVFMGGVFFLFRDGELNALKITKIKYDEGLRWPPFDILSRNNQPKTRGRDGGGMG